jgi:hypothetical protein
MLSRLNSFKILSLLSGLANRFLCFIFCRIFSIVVSHRLSPLFIVVFLLGASPDLELPILKIRIRSWWLRIFPGTAVCTKVFLPLRAVSSVFSMAFFTYGPCS